MNIICSRDDLMKGMNIVSRAVPVRTTMEILKCVLLQAEESALKLTANDTSLGIETSIEATVKEPGTIAIDASLFSAIVRKLPDSDVYISSDEKDSVTIKCESAQFNIAGRGTDDFVDLPQVETENFVTLSQFTVKEMIGQVIFSIADSDLNAAMSGVYVEVYDGKIRFTTLDGHRISIRVNELKEDYGKFSAIVPGKTFSDLSKIIIGNQDSEIKISFSKNHVIFEYDETRVVSRLIDGDYFRIDTMLRSQYETRVRVNKRVLTDCLDRSTLLVNENDKKPVIMTISDDEMGIKLKSAIGLMNEAIPVEKSGNDIKIAFNPRLLLDALRVIEDEEIEMYLVKYNYPCTIKNEEETYSYVVLPVNFTED